MSIKVPQQLQGKVWHSTTLENANEIVRKGYILAEPNIDQSKRWGRNDSSAYPFVRSIGGISLFDFRLPSSHSNPMLYSFVPCKAGYTQTVWFEIDIQKLDESFLSADETREQWKASGMVRNYMPKLEACSLCPIPTNLVKSVYISNKHGTFKLLASIEELA
ncbi:hypothetical protein ACPV5H_26345 [Vibrio harveyi]|uniref:hypothetical protein n=1 Tax=Vibrio harveyi TaxID=669 RepID=UPI0040689052